MELNKKKEIVTQLHEDLKKSKIVIVTDFKGLDVAAVTKLRSQLTKENIDYRVIKNTLLRRASENTSVAVLNDLFKGPSAVAISYDDPVSPAKILTKFAEENKKLEIKGGVMDGKAIDFNGIKATGFDGRGNYTLGVTEQIIFPEIDIDKVNSISGMDISFVTSADTDKEAKSLLTELGLPFQKN